MNSSEFILLHTTGFGEKSMVLHTLSKDYGRKGLFIKNISRRSVTSMFFPLGIMEADICETSGSGLFTARNPSLRYPLTGLRNNLRKSAISMFISEVLPLPHSPSNARQKCSSCGSSSMRYFIFSTSCCLPILSCSSTFYSPNNFCTRSETDFSKFKNFCSNSSLGTGCWYL